MSDVLGPNFSKEKLKITVPFIERAYRDQIEACKEVKKHFNRQRPLVLDPKIKPVYQQAANASYPSGHATTGYVYTIILSMMLPEKAQVRTIAQRFMGAIASLQVCISLPMLRPARSRRL